MNGSTSTWLGGHGGIVGYDEKGSTKYYEYGRYNPSLKGIIGVKLPTDDGNVRNVSMPNLVLDKDGSPTNESLEKLKTALSTKAGKNTNAELTCSKDIDEKKYMNISIRWLMMKKEINIIGIHYHQISAVVFLTMLSMRGTEL